MRLGRIRGLIYDTPDRMAWATSTLLDRFYQQPTRDDMIRQRHAAGERTGALAQQYGLSAARVSQIIGHFSENSKTVPTHLDYQATDSDSMCQVGGSIQY